MEDLKFYDFEFNLLHIEPNFSSVYWNLKYNGIGTFEATFSVSDIICSICTRHKFLIVCQGGFQAIITGKQIYKNNLTITGRTVNFLLEKRTIAPFSTYHTDVKKDASSLARYVVETSCKDFVTLGKTVECEESGEFWRYTMHPAIEVVCDCLDKNNLGHRLFFDAQNKKFIFDIIKGTTRELVLSDDNLNTYDSEYAQSLLDYATSGYFYKNLTHKGDWNPSSNIPTLNNNLPENYALSYKVSESGSRFGIDFEKDDYIICTSKSGAWEKSKETEGFWEYLSSNETGVYRWDAVLSETNENSAQKQLSDKKATQKLSAKIRTLTFGKDFNLGDIMKISMKAGNETFSFRQIITAVTIWYESNNSSGVKPEFKEII